MRSSASARIQAGEHNAFRFGAIRRFPGLGKSVSKENLMLLFLCFIAKTGQHLAVTSSKS